MFAFLLHPSRCSYVDHFMYKNHLCIVTDYCEAGDLYQLLRARKAPLAEPQILEWFVQIVMAIQYVHTKNILHRDLKVRSGVGGKRAGRGGSSSAAHAGDNLQLATGESSICHVVTCIAPWLRRLLVCVGCGSSGVADLDLVPRLLPSLPACTDPEHLPHKGGLRKARRLWNLQVS